MTPGPRNVPTCTGGLRATVDQSNRPEQESIDCVSIWLTDEDEKIAIEEARRMNPTL